MLTSQSSRLTVDRKSSPVKLPKFPFKLTVKPSRLGLYRNVTATHNDITVDIPMVANATCSETERYEAGDATAKEEVEAQEDRKRKSQASARGVRMELESIRKACCCCCCWLANDDGDAA